MKLLSKISAATVFGKISKDVKEEFGLMRVIGIATGTKTGSTQFGEWIALSGNFKATNLVTGEEFRSGKCFVPQIALSMVEGALASQDAKAVQFAFDIGVKPANNAYGYEYTVTPLIQATDNDPIELLSSSLPALQLGTAKMGALPAPSEPAPDEIPAPETKK